MKNKNILFVLFLVFGVCNLGVDATAGAAEKQPGKNTSTYETGVRRDALKNENEDKDEAIPTVVAKNISFAQCGIAEDCCEENDCNFKCSPTTGGKYNGSCDCERTPSGEEVNIDEYTLGWKEGKVEGCMSAAGFTDIGVY